MSAVVLSFSEVATECGEDISKHFHLECRGCGPEGLQVWTHVIVDICIYLHGALPHINI